MRYSNGFGLTLAVGIALALSAARRTGAFIPGDLVVLEVGDGINPPPAGGTGTPFALEEYTVGGSAVQNIAVPTSLAGSHGLVVSGSAASEGQLSLSADGHSLVFAGYVDSDGVASVSSASAASYPRGCGTVDYTGTYAFGATFAPANGTNLDYDSNNVRGAVTDGTDFWGAGAGKAKTGGIGGTIMMPGSITFTGGVANSTSVGIQNGNLYYATRKGGIDGNTSVLYGFSGLPTTPDATPTAIITGPSDASGGFAGFAISPDGSTAYVAYSGTATTAGVQKYSYSGGAWSYDYDLAPGITGVTALAVNFATDTIYAVNPTNLYQIADAGSGSAATSLTTAVDNYSFRGLEFAPTPLLGDADENGTVNGADLNTVLSNFNNTGMEWAEGDFDGNGTVNGADLNTVLSNFNQHLGVGTAVPEPASIVLLALGTLMLLGYGRRRPS